MISVAAVGLKPCAGGANAVAVTAAAGLTLPTAIQRVTGGALVARVVIEGIGNPVHYDWAGTPSAVAGLPAPTPTANSPVTMDFEGEALLAVLKFQGTGAAI